MALRPANWYEDTQAKADLITILSFLVHQAGGRIHIPYGEILPIMEETGDKSFALQIDIDNEGGWIARLIEVEPATMQRYTTYMGSLEEEEFYGPENEAADQT